jgi:hypothetical protein
VGGELIGGFARDSNRSGEDRQTDKERKLYLKWLNAGYD